MYAILISFRLFENYEYRRGKSIPQPDILNKIPAEQQLAAWELTPIVRSILPGVTTKRRRDSETFDVVITNVNPNLTVDDIRSLN